jgi:small subunit ribosomal protein S4e
MPVNLIVRDVLGRAQSAREVRFIVHSELIKVDGRVCKDTRRGVGLMDVLSLGDEHFRCMLDANGRLRYVKISAEEASWKLVRVEGKTTLKGGKTQLNFHDGRNMLVDDPKEFNTGDSIKLSLPDQEVLEHIKFEDGVRCYLIGGTHVGEMASMKERIVKRSSMPNEVAFDEFGTTEVNVFAVGDANIPAMEVKA